MLLHYIQWNVHPEILPGILPVRWYGLLFAGAFLAGYLVLIKIFKNEFKNQKQATDLLDKMAIYTLIATVIGARIGHTLFYEPAYYLRNPIEIFMVWQGGLASHGAAIGILIGIWLYSKKIRKPFLWSLDRLVIVVALGGAFIRAGNLMNSEIYGHATNLPWAFIFNNDGIPRHPTQIYEALSYLAIFFFLYKYYWMQKGKPKEGYIFGMFLILLFTSRFFIEFLKEVQVNFEEGMALNMGQWLSIPFIIAGVVIIYLQSKKNSSASK